MGALQLPTLAALTDKMRWHQARQKLLAENVANAETPGYQGRDLKAYSFSEHLREASFTGIATMATSPGHIVAASPGGQGMLSGEGGFRAVPEEGDGNTRGRDDEDRLQPDRLPGGYLALQPFPAAHPHRAWTSGIGEHAP